MLRRHDVRLKKSFGQNFLIDRNILAWIADLAQLDRDCGVIEVGPGTGNLTVCMAQKAGFVYSFEIDKRLTSIIEENLAGYDNFSLVMGDVMKQDLSGFVDELTSRGLKKIKVVANLPYGITTPFILGILRDEPRIEQLVLTIQKEVAERFCARAGTKEYGFASVAGQLHADIKIEKHLNKNCFFPAPAVTSSVIVFSRRQLSIHPDEEKKYLEMIKILFTGRRKTIKTVLLKNGFIDENKAASISSSIDLSRRVETFTLEELLDLGRLVFADNG